MSWNGESLFQSALLGGGSGGSSGGGDEDAIGALIDGSIMEIDNSTVTSIRTYAMRGCEYLKKVNLSAVKKVYSNAFQNCSALTEVNLPALSSMSDYVFYGCIALPMFDVSTSVSRLTSYCFYNCTKLEALIIRRTASVCTLFTINSLQNTPIASGDGYIYVPSALIDTYKAETNWSTYADQFRPLEDYTVDGTVTGALDESKIQGGAT